MKKYYLLLVFSFTCLLLFPAHNLTINGQTSATVTLGDQIEIYFEYETIGNSATISFMIDIPLIDTSSLDFIQGTLVDGGTLDTTPMDGVFQASIPAFWQPPSGLPLQIMVVDGDVTAQTTVTFVALNSTFTISGSVKKEGSYIDLPVFPAVVNVLYNTDLLAMDGFDFDLGLDSLLTFFENRYLVTEINGILGNYTATIPDSIANVSCVVMPLTLLDFAGTHNIPETRIEIINGPTSGINFLYTLPDCVFTGTVASTEGEPITYAAINLYSSEDSNNAFGMSDGEGNFSIPLDNGTYNLNVVALGYSLYSQELVVNNQNINMDIVLEPVNLANATLSGTIVDIEGNPIPDADIMLLSTESYLAINEVSDTNGSFSILLDNGTYELTISAPGYYVYTSEVVINYLNINLEIALDPVSNDDNNIIPVMNMEVSAYPNPFVATMNIEINTARKEAISAKIYNLRGQLITTIDLPQNVANPKVVWNGNNSKNQKVANGIYLLQVVSGVEKVNKKIILMRF
ncbi:MAG: carboxypeptidase regulatory-like domain-containing protein [Candidatus Cloacimonadales bacterium]